MELVEIVDCGPAAFTEVFNQPLYKEYRIGPHPFTEEDSRKFFINKVARWNSGQEFVYAAVQEGSVIGVVSLHSLQATHRYGHIFYWFSLEHRGRGLASEAVIELVHLAFGRHDLVRLEAQLRTDNVPSRRLLERIGFKKEAFMESKFINNERSYDGYQYRLLIDEYKDGWAKKLPPKEVLDD